MVVTIILADGFIRPDSHKVSLGNLALFTDDFKDLCSLWVSLIY